MSVKSRSSDKEPAAFVMLQQHLLEVFSGLNVGIENRLLIAVSGGLDSVALLTTLHEAGFKGIVAHVNYGLRAKESEIDQEFVEALAERLNWQAKVLNAADEMASHPGESTQMVARRIRYEWFEQLRSDNDLDYVVTAHHAEDNAETFFINFLRGSGTGGLKAMQVKNGRIIRPFLKISREIIRNAAIEKGMHWREDSSNATDDYLRNRIRHHLLPILAETDPSFLKKLDETFMRLNSEHSLLNELIKHLGIAVKKDGKPGLTITKALLSQFADPAFLLYQVTKEFGFSYDLCVQTCSNLTATNERVFYSNTWKLTVDRTQLFVSQSFIDKIDPCNHDLKDFVFEELTEYIDIKGQTSLSEALIDSSEVKGNWNVRNWRNADWFYPSGMKGRKLLSDFFTDLKLSSEQKKSQLLLCNDEDIVWVVNRRIDGRYAATGNTQHILKITYKTNK